jgi:hypothetical protein
MERSPDEVIQATTALARSAGFVVIDEPFHAYENVDNEQIIVAEWDSHPNARGHRILADALYQALVQHRGEVFGAPAQAKR